MAEVNLKVSADIQGIKTKLEELTKSVAEVQAKMGTSMKAAAETSEKAMVDASNTITNTIIGNTAKQIDSEKKRLAMIDQEIADLNKLKAARDSSASVAQYKSLDVAVKNTEKAIRQLSQGMAINKDITKMSMFEMRDYLKELKRIPAPTAEVKAQIAKLTDAYWDSMKAAKTTGDGMQVFIGAMQGFIGIAQGVTGTLALMGIENKNLEKSMMALINLSQMMSTFHQLEESGMLRKIGATIKSTIANTENTVSLWANAKAQKASSGIAKSFFSVIAKNPMAALTLGISAAALAAYGLVKALSGSKSTLDELRESQAQIFDESYKLAGQIKSLGDAVLATTTGTKENTAAIDQYNKVALDQNLILLDATDSYWEQSDAIRANNKLILERSKIQAAMGEIDKNNAEIVKKQIELNELQQKQGVVQNNALDAVTNGLKNEIKELENKNKALLGLSETSKANVSAEEARVQAQRDQAKKTAQAVRDSIKLAQDTYDKELTAAKEAQQNKKTIQKTTLDDTSKFYGEYFMELERHNKALSDINKAQKEGTIKTEKEYNERLLIEQQTHDRNMYELEKSDEEDFLNLIEENATERARIKQEALDNEAAIAAEAVNKQIRIDEGWYVDEIFRREENLNKRLKLLKEYHDKKLILDKDYEEATKETEQQIWDKRIEIATKVTRQLYDVYKSSIDDQIKAYDNLINQREQRIGEIQSLLEAEIQLNKDGFASNIGLYQSQLEQEQKLRDEALAQQDKYNKRKAVMESFEQSMDISSAIASILADAGVKFGVAAPIVGGMAIAALLTLFKQQQAKGAVKFEKGGRGVFEGADHAHGGIPFGNNKEAQGGEAYYILNRAATNSKGRKLMDVLFDAVNGGRVNFDAPLALADTPISVEMKEQREIKEIWKHLKGQKSIIYAPTYRIETFGNVKRKILN